MRKPRSFAFAFAAAIAVSSVTFGTSPAAADTMVGACNVVSNPTSDTHTVCIGAAPTGGDFSGLDLSFADFTGSNLAGSNFTGANLTSADLTGASAAGTNFTNGNLTDTNFTGADIAGAGFTGASVIPDDVTVVSPDGNPTTYAFPAIGIYLTRSCTPLGPFAVGPTTVTCSVSTLGTITTSTDATFVVTVVVPAGITGASTAMSTAGSTGTYVPTSVTGTPAPVITAAGLPSGLTADGTTGAITGAPSAGSGGVYTVMLTASNGVTPDATLNVELTVNEDLVISGDPTITFTEDDPGGHYLPTVTGFPAPVFSASGLPAGLTIDPTTGEITGTPDDGSAGTYPIVITASNGVGPGVVLNLVLTVDPATPTDGPAGPDDEASSDDALLPDTGGVPLTLLLLGVALLVAGTVLTRRSDTTPPRHRIET